MKNLVWVLLCLLAVGESCKKKEVAPGFFLKATIDEKLWEASTVSRTLGVKNPDGTQHILYTGQNSNKEVLSLIFYKQPSTAGTFMLGQGGIGMVIYSVDAFQTYSSVNSRGKIIIESISEEAMTGSFEIAVTGGPPAKTMMIKEGSFKFSSK